MKTQLIEKQIARVAFNFATRNEAKTVKFGTMTKEEKIQYFETIFEAPEKLSDKKDVKIKDLTQEQRFQLIAENSQKPELIQKLCIGQSEDTISVTIKTDYQKASQTAKIAYYSKLDNTSDETEVELPTIFGKNLLRFAKYIVQNWGTITNEPNEDDYDPC